MTGPQEHPPGTPGKPVASGPGRRPDTAEVAAVFDRVAPGYDKAALRLFPFCADLMASWLRPRPGSRILDVATGTGALALSLAQMLGGRGRVHGIDLSAGMLARAAEHARRMGLDNLDLHHMDAQRLEFRSGYFDAVTCSFGLFFLPDMGAALRSWLRVLKPGGTLMFSTFAEGAFSPLADRLLEALAQRGVEGARRPPLWMALARPGAARALLEEAGAVEIEVRERQIGYHLSPVDEWWELVWNSGWRGLLESLPRRELEALRLDHLRELDGEAGERGLWLNVPVRIFRARRPRTAEAPVRA